MSAFRLVITDKFVTGLLTLKLCLSPVASKHTSAIRTHIDSHFNEDCFSIDRVPRSQRNLDNGHQNSLLPCPLTIFNNSLITNTDVLLHLDYPGLEGKTRSSPFMFRIIFLIPFLSHNGSCWYIRSLLFKEQLSMYTAQLSITSNSTLVSSPTLPDLSSMLYEMCSCYISASIDHYIAELLRPSVLDPHYSNVVYYYINKPLFSEAAWYQAYADDEGTNFIMFRLMVDTP